MRLSLFIVLKIGLVLLGTQGSLAAQPATILLLGDSLSAAHGIDVSESWPVLLQQRLDREHPGKTLINASVSGETTAGGLQRLPALLDRHNPDVVIIELGGNDGLRGLRLTTIKKNIAEMILASQAIGARVLLIGMHLPPNYGPKYVSDFHNIYTELKDQKGTALLPFLLEGIALSDGMMQADGIHQTAKAQRPILDNVWTVLEPILK